MEKKIKIEQTNTNTNRRVLFSLICLTIASLFFFSISLSIQAAQPGENKTINQLEQYLTGSSYSDFQKKMVTNTVQEAINKGISSEDTLSIVKGSIDNEADAYNVKKFLDTIISAKNDGISEKPLVNKIKEGLAKNIEERFIINAINQKSENMRIAQNLLVKNRIQNGELEEMIDILADSLTNGVPESTLAQVLKISSEQNTDWQEVEEVATELADLGLKAIEFGIGIDNIETIFNQALDSENSLESICMNIQDLIVATIATQVSSSSLQRDAFVKESNSGTSSLNSPSSSSGSAITGSSSSTSSGETGSSPISSGGDSTTDNESGSSPLK